MAEAEVRDKQVSYQSEPSAKKRVRFIRPSERVGLIISSTNVTWARAQYRLLPSAPTRPDFLPLRLLGLDPSGAPSAIPAIDDITSVPPPNLYAVFVLQRMEHAVVSGGGVPQSWVWWKGSSPATIQDKAGPYTYPLPEAGETFVIPSDHGNAIYQGFALNGCSSATLSFPVTLESWIVEGDGISFGAEIGRVSPTDDDTITRAGLYEFYYVIRARGTNGGVSDFTISGIVSVSCTNDAGI